MMVTSEREMSHFISQCLQSIVALVKQATELKRLSSVICVNTDLAIPCGHKSYDPAGSHGVLVGKG